MLRVGASTYGFWGETQFSPWGTVPRNPLQRLPLCFFVSGPGQATEKLLEESNFISDFWKRKGSRHRGRFLGLGEWGHGREEIPLEWPASGGRRLEALTSEDPRWSLKEGQSPPPRGAAGRTPKRHSLGTVALASSERSPSSRKGREPSGLFPGTVQAQWANPECREEGKGLTKRFGACDLPSFPPLYSILASIL